ncbi:hypothetical protein PV04_04298 [Phialophora macrospora]|uniref:Uncharacterized protein n=1 Tax=Phialophora macrospora TaxID=1851006 RepID=A0A0D2FP30_9EURO|nr:hypothetical protein PV04_04298 [Phialophora macrospora]
MVSTTLALRVMSPSTGAKLGIQTPAPLSVDEQMILSVFEANGIFVKDDMKPAFLHKVRVSKLDTAVQLAEFAGEICELSGIDLHPFGLAGKALKATQQVLAIREAQDISTRYLSAIATAKGLEPQSVKIIAAVKEVSERTIDRNDIINLDAEANAVQEYLRQEISPFMSALARRGHSEIPMTLLRRKRDEVKSKREHQRRIVQVYLGKIGDGFSHMEQETYSISTNHMPRYAAACALEVLLAGYYCMLGLIDTEDFMVAHDLEVLKTMVAEKSLSIRSLLDRYAEARSGLVCKKSEIDWTEECYISDNGARDDAFAPRVNLEEFATDVETEGFFTTGRLKSDGRYKYESVSWSGNNYAAQAGDKLVDKVRESITTSVQPQGDVWETHFAKHVDNIQLVLDVVLGHENGIRLKIEEAKKLLAAKVKALK